MFRSLRTARSEAGGPKYAFCERVTASPMSPHHIRALTDAGMKLGGGADSPALCGAQVSWDTSGVKGDEDWEYLTRPRADLRDASWRACAECVGRFRANG